MTDKDAPAAGDSEPQSSVDDDRDAPAEQPDRPAETQADPEQTPPAKRKREPRFGGRPQPGFPVVGIGASAGGLAAIEAFFAAMQGHADSGAAFVIVQHLDPKHKSILVDLVQQYTRMAVRQVTDGMQVQPNCVYVIPPNRDIALMDGHLHLFEPNAPRGMRLPIDFFFRSLAQDQREQAICIVLSGTGSDGTLGLRTVKEAGGMAMAQAPESAAYDGMPRNAIASRLVDYVLPPDQMPGHLTAYVQRAFGRPPVQPATAPPFDETLEKILVLLRVQSSHDFSGYKRATVQRRIDRRMAVAQIDRLADYLKYLRENPAEVHALFRELMIGVTNFFRDPEAFAALQEKVIPELFSTRRSANARVWVPACSSGEEAYSHAILIREYLDEMRLTSQVQVFATDIDDEAIERARLGVYPESIAADVTAERLARYFIQTDGSYKISKTIRDMVVFAKQDILKDPPFSRIDLISCRNLLIYLDADAQERILQLFYYALNQGRFLFLGNSESIGTGLDQFSAVDKKWRIYRKRDSGVLLAAGPFSPPSLAETPASQPRPVSRPFRKGSIRDLAERVLLESYLPASVLIDAEYNVLYIHGRTGKYLEPASGEASLNLLRMAREGLRMPLAIAIRQAISQQAVVRYEGAYASSVSGGAPGSSDTMVNLIVHPVNGTDVAPGLALVIFEDAPPAPAQELPADADPEGAQKAHIVRLEQELRSKEEYLQATIEELQTTNEELKSTNEELQSANEELQSTNEELSTSKEELQSVNEELSTVNAELLKKIEEVGLANNDLSNLLASTGIATLFVDHQLRVHRFTPATKRVINLIPADVGRSVSDIVPRLPGYDHLVPDVREVLDTLIPKEITVQNQDGVWYQLRIQPYRTLENVIDGAVLTFVDVTRQKLIQDSLRASQEKLTQLFELLPVGVSVLDDDGNLTYANPAFASLLGLPCEDLLEAGRARYAYIRPDGTRMPPKEVASSRALQEKKAIDHVETGILKADGTVVWTDMSAVPLALPGWQVITVVFNLTGSGRGPGESGAREAAEPQQ